MLRAVDCVLEGATWAPDTQANWRDNFYFVQAADTQLGLMYNFGTDGTNGTPYPDSAWDQEVELCRKSVEILNSLQPKPAFFIVCGDLVDAFSDEYPEVRERQEEDFKAVYSKLDPDIPMICVCGNHDVGNSPTSKSIQRYKDSFGSDYFSFYHQGVACLVLNSQFYEDHSHVTKEYEAHEKWLQEQLAKAKEWGVTHILVFQHIPWFLRVWDEDKEYFNVEKDLRFKKLEELHQAGVKKVFCGHYHRNAGGMYKSLEVVITSAIGCQIPDPEEAKKDPTLREQHGMRIVTVTKEEIKHEYHTLKTFPTRIHL